VFKFGERSLSTQIVLISIALVVFTATAAGIPAIWLIRQQLNRQAWSQVEQGSYAAQALYLAQTEDLTNLALLTAQRPTLLELLMKEETTALVDYLRTLQLGEDVDLILVCDKDQRVVPTTGLHPESELCQVENSGFQVLRTGTGDPRVWHVGVNPIALEDNQGKVIVARRLGETFVGQMRAKTGLEHTIIAGQQPVASSLPNYPDLSNSASIRATADDWHIEFIHKNVPYYARGFSLKTAGDNSPTLDAEVALQVHDIVMTQQELILTFLITIVVVAGIGTVLGVLFARHISHPLNQLANSAVAVGLGNLESPVTVDPGTYEVNLVAETLENARATLQKSITALQQEKIYTNHLLNSIAEGIVTLDDRLQITFFSQGAERITGLKHEDILSRHCNEVFSVVEPVEPFSQLIPAFGSQVKLTIALPSGQQALLSITGAELNPPNTENTAVALVFRDVSREEAIHRIIGHFLANVSHEFRTPLSSLAASIELLLDQAPSLSGLELQRLLSALHLSTLNLQTLVDNLLEGASIEAGHFRVHARATNLTKIIAEAVRTIQPLLDKREQTLLLELPTHLPAVYADVRRTVQVLVNLLSNASKYGPGQAEIALSALISGDFVRIEVADRGPGIPPALRNDLFRRFVYPHSEGDKARYGAGLGLLVVKAVVEAQGGNVGVEDRLGGGSVFWFTLAAEETK
jgi:PAS domain S-box-containing protein